MSHNSNDLYAPCMEKNKQTKKHYKKGRYELTTEIGCLQPTYTILQIKVIFMMNSKRKLFCIRCPCQKQTTLELELVDHPNPILLCSAQLVYYPSGQFKKLNMLYNAFRIKKD